MSPSALIVFAKVPEPGKVKTRLTELLTPAQAAELYTAFLADALAQYAAMDVDVRLYLPPSDKTMPAGVVPEPVSRQAQTMTQFGGQAPFICMMRLVYLVVILMPKTLIFRLLAYIPLAGILFSLMAIVMLGVGDPLAFALH